MYYSLTVEEQVKNIELFNSQIEKVSAKYNNVIILGDANLCSDKWNDPGFKNKIITSNTSFLTKL